MKNGTVAFDAADVAANRDAASLGLSLIHIFPTHRLPGK